jgi:hypothetical protein
LLYPAKWDAVAAYIHEQGFLPSQPTAKIAEVLRFLYDRRPAMSLRAIGAQVGLHHDTVGKIRDAAGVVWGRRAVPIAELNLASGGEALARGWRAVGSRGSVCHAGERGGHTGGGASPPRVPKHRGFDCRITTFACFTAVTNWV